MREPVQDLTATGERDARVQEHHLEVTRTARYWTLGDPDGADELWFVLHGYRQLARRFLRRFEPIARRLIVAPEGLSRFYVSSERGRHGAGSVVGASWMTREDRLAEIADYVAYLGRLEVRIRAEMAAHDPAVTLLGFSQGVATACRWVVRGDVRPERLVLWGDFLPPDLDMGEAARALAGVDLVLVRGSEDPALSPELAAAEAQRLAASGLEARTVRFEGGHEIDEETLKALLT